MMAIATTAGIVTVTSAPAQAVSCWGDWCSGQDPNATGCADPATAKTVRSATINMADGMGGYYDVATLEVRWSPVCKTNWARLSIFRYAYGINGIYLRQDSNYEVYKKTMGEASGTNVGVFWTPMIYSPDRRVFARIQKTWPDPCTVCQTDWV